MFTSLCCSLFSHGFVCFVWVQVCVVCEWRGRGWWGGGGVGGGGRGLKDMHSTKALVAHVAQKIFRLHFSVIKRGFRGIFVFAKQVPDVQG